MQIIPFEKQHVPDVTRLVNTQIAMIPPHWQLSESQVWDILQKDSLWEIHYQDEEPPAWTWNNEIICVVEGERVLAAGRIDYRYDNGQLGMAAARWMVSDHQYPVAINMLLEYLIAKRGEGHAEILINGRSDFGIGWSGIPTTDLGLNTALEAKGFVVDQKWFIMTADIQSFINQDLPVVKLDQHLKWVINESRLEWHLNLYDGETLIGECQSWGIPPEFAACDGYNDWMQIEWLGVEEDYRRRGLARGLLTEQLRYHVARGKRYCFAYTSTGNTATFNLNTSLGFTVKAEVWGWTWPCETRK